MSVSIVEFEKALLSLQEALNELNREQHSQSSAFYKFVRDAAIQRFEYSIEIAWKVSAKVLGSKSTAAKPVVREMAQNQLISDPNLWFDFIEGRNKTSHAYDEDIAVEVIKIATAFFPEAQQLLANLKNK